MVHGSQPSTVDVSIVLPVYNDEAWIANAIKSCLNQTLHTIEIIVVDDASTDSTVTIVEQLQATDSRIKLVRQTLNGSAFQARRAGLNAASAQHVMFVDGDDELRPKACETVAGIAKETGADIVAFGCEVVAADGSTGSHYEGSMQPRHRELRDHQILATLFPTGKTAQGQLWRYLFARDLLLDVYSSLPSDLTLPRMNDLPIAFLALMKAKHYISTRDRLYRYFFRRGASGHQVATWADFLFNASALKSIESISEAVSHEANTRADSSRLLETYESTRSSVIGRVLGYVNAISDEQLQKEALEALGDQVGRLDLIKACADFFPSALPILTQATNPPSLPSSKPHHVVLRTGNLNTGGVQGVLVAQAGHLIDAGIKVTIVIDSDLTTSFELPPGVELLQIRGQTRGQRMAFLVELCRERGTEVVIDHHIFYNDRWPYFAQALSIAGIPTIGWIHNFALRPLLDQVDRLSFLDSYLPILNTVVVLSEPDVAYWKLRGLPNVVYLPNPPSPLVKNITAQFQQRPAPRNHIEIVWWGRLQQRTKQVLDLVDVGAQLKALDVDFHITIIGPDGPDLTAEKIRRRARDKGLEDRLTLTGQLHGEELIRAAQSANVFVSTSIVEGYPLALVEAQALGLPVVMYDLPWLEFLRENAGAIAVPQGDRNALAAVLADLINNEADYAKLTAGARKSTQSEVSHDLKELYARLLVGDLNSAHSPEPDRAAMKLLLDQNIRFIERLERVHRRELKRKENEFARQTKRLEERVSKSGPVVRQNTPTPRDAPQVPALKAWLQRFLPATMRQAAYYAKHEYSVAERQHALLLKNQETLSAQLARIEGELSTRRK